MARRTLSTADLAALERMSAHKAEVARIVAAGVCPRCGRKLKANLSLTGWWQCSQFGAVGFRADAEQPSCNWQDFV